MAGQPIYRRSRSKEGRDFRSDVRVAYGDFGRVLIASAFPMQARRAIWSDFHLNLMDSTYHSNCNPPFERGTTSGTICVCAPIASKRRSACLATRGRTGLPSYRPIRGRAS